MALIEHVCLNCADIEKEKSFYVAYFGFLPNRKYRNPKSGWENYFLVSPEGGARLELLAHDGMGREIKNELTSGLVHFALALGSAEAVDEMALRLKREGYALLSGPRKTGDGYYEAAFLDPEGNQVEITV